MGEIADCQLPIGSGGEGDAGGRGAPGHGVIPTRGERVGGGRATEQRGEIPRLRLRSARDDGGGALPVCDCEFPVEKAGAGSSMPGAADCLLPSVDYVGGVGDAGGGGQPPAGSGQSAVPGNEQPAGFSAFASFRGLRGHPSPLGSIRADR